MQTRSRLWLAILAAAAGCTFDPKELSTPGVIASDGGIDATADQRPGDGDLPAGGADTPVSGPEAPVVQPDGGVSSDGGPQDRSVTVDSGNTDSPAVLDGSAVDSPVGVDGGGVEAARDTSDGAEDRAASSRDSPPDAGADAPPDQLPPPLDAPAPRSDGPADSDSQRDAAPAVVCKPPITSTGGLPCPGGVCAVGSYSGPMWTTVDTSGSTICVAAESLCANGNIPLSARQQMGAVVGFYLENSAAHEPVQLSSSGITLQLTALPSLLMRVWVTHLETMYCADIYSATKTIPWTSFRSSCWNTSGSNLTGPPNTSYIAFQVAATTTATFDFCVISVSF